MRFAIGDFAEGQGDHYVVLEPDNIHDINDIQSQNEECNIQDELYPNESLESEKYFLRNGNFFDIFFLLLILERFVTVDSLHIVY